MPLTPMPRPRLDATSDPEKPAIKKSSPGMARGIDVVSFGYSHVFKVR